MTALFACTSCMGAAEGPLIDAARLGIWLMIGVTAAIQGCFVAFFLYLRKRAKMADHAAQLRAQLKLVGGGSARS